MLNKIMGLVGFVKVLSKSVKDGAKAGWTENKKEKEFAVPEIVTEDLPEINTTEVPVVEEGKEKLEEAKEEKKHTSELWSKMKDGFGSAWKNVKAKSLAIIDNTENINRKMFHGVMAALFIAMLIGDPILTTIALTFSLLDIVRNTYLVIKS